MSNSFWLFRTNLRPLEYYHKYKTLEEFREKCHDFYLTMGLWYLRKGIFNEFVVWRLNPKGKKLPDIVFKEKGGKFIQRWVTHFNEVFKYTRPRITLFRGGFPEYCQITKASPAHFGKKLYLGAGKRIFPQHGGVYDLILLESENDVRDGIKSAPFFKTANPYIFKPLELERTYDLCWICNFRQVTQKGQDFFIKAISEFSFLRSSKIVHCGNKPDVGKCMCRKYGIDNIDFKGWLERPKLNKVLNQSKFAIVTSNQNDGCPRVLTEIMMSGTPLLVRQKTRFLNFYKKHAVLEYNDLNIGTQAMHAINYYDKYLKDTDKNVKGLTTMMQVCTQNLKIWT